MAKSCWEHRFREQPSNRVERYRFVPCGSAAKWRAKQHCRSEAVLAVIALRAKMIGLSDHVQPRASWEMIFKMENYSNPLLWDVTRAQSGKKQHMIKLTSESELVSLGEGAAYVAAAAVTKDMWEKNFIHFTPIFLFLLLNLCHF